jgi:hypothetical protein
MFSPRYARKLSTGPVPIPGMYVSGCVSGFTHTQGQFILLDEEAHIPNAPRVDAEFERKLVDECMAPGEEAAIRTKRADADVSCIV